MKATDNVCVADDRSDIPVSRSEALVQSAIGLLQLRHSLTYQHSALKVMQDTSQRLGCSCRGWRLR